MVTVEHAPELERMPVTIEVKREAAIGAPARKLLQGAIDMIVDSSTMYGIAADEVAAAKAMKRTLNEERLELTRPLDELKAKLMDKYRPALECCDQVITALEPKMLIYRNEQKRIADEERARAEAVAAEARKRLEEEAREIQRKADEAAREVREKLEAEQRVARAKAQAEADALAAAGKAKEAEEATARAEAEAWERAQAAGRAAAALREQAEREAEDRRKTADLVLAAPVVTATPEAKGTSVRTTWKARVDDKGKFVAFVAAHPEFIELLDVNEASLNAMARSLKKNLRFDGVTAYEDQGITSRAVRA